jgi:signal transduction histidine kinase
VTLQERARSLLWLVPTIALLIAAAALWTVTGRIYRELASQLAVERVHVERVQELERAAAAAHVAVIARWVSDNTRRAQRDEQTLEAVRLLRAALDHLAELVPFDDDEQAAGERLIAAAALMSNQVQQGLCTSDAVGTTSDLEQSMATLRTHATSMTASVSRVGSSSDARLRRLRTQQVALEVAFVIVALAILTFAMQSLRHRLHVSEQMRVVQAQAAAERAQFFANMSHELRTPLAAIRGFAINISDEGARQIEAHAQDLLGVINNILDAAKLEAGAMQLHLESIDVAEVLDRCAARCKSLVGQKPLQLQTEFARPLHARGDFVKLQQVITNLMANAIKFTERGRVLVRARRRDDVVEIFVEDTGIGISAEALGRLWRPFQQAERNTDRRYGGTGLGLSIVRGLVERMKGQVTVDSEVGRGSCFTVRLPAAQGQSDQPLERAS